MYIDYLGYFDIELSNIWKYHLDLIYHELKVTKKQKYSKDQGYFLRDLYVNTKHICITHGNHFISKKGDVEGYLQFQKTYRSKNSLKDKIEYGMFDYKEAIYHLNQKIIIPKDNEEFHFFFALKLDQYEENIFLLDEFFNHQLLLNFNEDLEKMMVFLDNLLIQYQFLGDRTYEKTNKFIQDIKQVLQQDILQSSKKSSPKNKKPTYQSFTLIGTKTDPDFFLRNNKALYNVFNLLREQKYIHNDTLFKQFRLLFTNEGFANNDRIHWTAKTVDLKAFITILCDKGKIIKPNKGIWILTSLCFIDKNKEDFNSRYLGNSTPSEDTKRIFRKIVSKFP